MELHLWHLDVARTGRASHSTLGCGINWNQKSPGIKVALALQPKGVKWKREAGKEVEVRSKVKDLPLKSA